MGVCSPCDQAGVPDSARCEAKLPDVTCVTPRASEIGFGRTNFADGLWPPGRIRQRPVNHLAESAWLDYVLAAILRKEQIGRAGRRNLHRQVVETVMAHDLDGSAVRFHTTYRVFLNEISYSYTARRYHSKSRSLISERKRSHSSRRHFSKTSWYF